jgi:DNA-binding NtrC family response regulator
MESNRILVIDDEPAVCKGCHLVLSENGYQVETCLNGISGLKTLRQEGFDLALLDMKLPDMNGMDLLRTIRHELTSVSVIVITGYSTVQDAVKAMKLGAYDYLSKPFSDDELLIAVQRAMDRKRVADENRALREQLLDRFSFTNIVGENKIILELFQKIEKVAPTDTTVLITGESGTGKELFAGAIHARSQHAAKHLVALDCSTLTPSLMESELFGHVKGAFTGAVRDKPGVFQVAHNGTLFLDEISNLSLETQGKLLRVLESQEYKPVGANSVKKTNTRIIAATNRDIQDLLEQGSFREDLFYRLNVFPLVIPPLRERRDDIPRLAYHFLRHYCRKAGKSIQGFSDEAMESLVNFDWPGNVRQLKNVVERLVILSDEGVLGLLNLMDELRSKRSTHSSRIPETQAALLARKKEILAQHFLPLQKAFLIKALKESEGNISKAARKVGLKRPNFYSLLKEHNISAESFRSGSGQSQSK